MNAKRFSGLVLIGLLYGQAAMGLLALAVMTYQPSNIVTADAGYGVTSELIAR